jgi:hypothetical protein
MMSRRMHQGRPRVATKDARSIGRPAGRRSNLADGDLPGRGRWKVAAGGGPGFAVAQDMAEAASSTAMRLLVHFTSFGTITIRVGRYNPRLPEEPSPRMNLRPHHRDPRLRKSQYTRSSSHAACAKLQVYSEILPPRTTPGGRSVPGCCGGFVPVGGGPTASLPPREPPALQQGRLRTVGVPRARDLLRDLQLMSYLASAGAA